MLLNIVLLCGGLFVLINKHIAALNKGIKIITSIIIIFVLISYFYYLSLALQSNLLVLALIFSGINFLLILTYFTDYKNIFTAKLQPLVNKKDIIFPLFIVFILTGYFFIYTKRWGIDDAIMIWNMHARFLFDVSEWQILFKNGVHPDYPLMLPGLIAFFWRLTNNISPFIPVFIAYFPLIFIPLLTCFALYEAKNNWLAWFSLSIFALSNNFITIGCSQGADSMLSLLILLAFILYTFVKRLSINTLYILGFVTASSTWIKNEGILFFVVFTIVFIVFNYKNKGFVKTYLIGAIIPLIVLLSFKLLYSPQNDLVSHANNTELLMHNLANFRRYLIVAEYLVSRLFYNYIDICILMFFVLIISPPFFKSQIFIVIALVIAGYFMIYITTPFDLHWHLATSANRLLQHFYPAMVFGIFYSIQTALNKKRILTE
jgi:hypothetical protein